MEKVVRNGMVAVLYSAGFGAGWYSWNTDFPQCLYDPEVVAWVAGGKKGDFPDLEKKYGCDYFCSLGKDTLEVEWLPEGSFFKVREYDGKECIETGDRIEWLVA